MEFASIKTWMAGASLLLATATYAQSLEIDKVHSVSKKASGFSIIDLSVDEAANDVAVTYFTKSKKDFTGDPKRLTFETYHFDLNYEFKNMEEQNIDIEKSRAKFKGFSFRGDEYKTIGVTPALFSPTLAFVKKETTYKWNWYTNAGYYKTVKNLDKVKLKDEGFGKVYYLTSSDNDSTLNVVGRGAEGGSNFLQLLTIDNNLNIYNTSKIPMPAYAMHASTMELPREDGYKDIVMVLQPFTMKGAAKPNSATDFKLIQLDGQTMKVIRNIDFTAPSSGFKLEYVSEEGNDLIMVGKIMNEVGGTSITEVTAPKHTAKSASVCVIKADKNKVTYAKAYNSEQLAANVSVVPGVKGKPGITSFLLYNEVSANKGEIYINAQNYSVNGKGEITKKDAVLLQIGTGGELKKTIIYPFDGELESKNFFSPTPNIMYWVVLDKRSKDKKDVTLVYPPYVFVSKIDLSSGTPGQIVRIGGEEAVLYMDYPVVPRSDANSVTFFGNKGKGTIWFGKMGLK